MQSTCSFPGCHKAAHAKKLCIGHYQQQRVGRELRPLLPSSWGLPVGDRFWAKVNKTAPNGCWEWTGANNGVGYGTFWLEGRHRLAHRVSWGWVNGPIPQGTLLDHRCHNPACVNPEHLRIVTKSENAQHLTRPGKDNTSGVRGVSWDKRRNAWHAYANLNGRRYHGGYHPNLNAADQAARALRAELHTHDDHDQWVTNKQGA